MVVVTVVLNEVGDPLERLRKDWLTDLLTQMRLNY